MSKKESKKSGKKILTQGLPVKNSSSKQNSEQESVPDYNEKFKVDMSFDELMKVLATGEVKKEE
jgi:hypothetical protein